MVSLSSHGATMGPLCIIKEIDDDDDDDDDDDNKRSNRIGATSAFLVALISPFLPFTKNIVGACNP